MNVLFLIHRYPPAQGGSERYVQEVAHRLVADGHGATVWTSNLIDVEGFWQRNHRELPACVEDDQGVRVHRFSTSVLPVHGPFSRLLGLVPWAPIGLGLAPPGLVMPDMWRAARSGGPFEVVHAAAYPGLMYLGSVTARRSAARLVLMPCSHLGPAQGYASPPRLDSRLLSLYRQADALVALTQLEKELLVGAGISPQRITVTGAGVHPAAAREAQGNAFRQKYGVAANRSILAFIGHKTPDKGALHFLEAAREIVTCRADVTIVMVGARTQVFTECYRSLPAPVREQVLDVCLDEPEKHNLLAASTALVLPSSVDGFGIVLLEAWLHGKPVVGALAGGIPAVVEHERTGLLVPYGDVPALVDAMCWLLDHPDRAAEMGEAGRRQTVEQWTWDRVYERLHPIYQDLLVPRGSEVAG